MAPVACRVGSARARQHGGKRNFWCVSGVMDLGNTPQPSPSCPGVYFAVFGPFFVSFQKRASGGRTPERFSTPHKKRTAPRPQTAHRGQGSIATTRATCDVRAELRLVHWAWRGRDSPAPQEHDGGLGSYFFSSVECTHRPLLRGYHHGHISRVAFLSCVLFSRHAVCSCGGRRLALCTWPTGQGA